MPPTPRLTADTTVGSSGAAPRPVDVVDGLATLIECEADEAERIGRLTDPVADAFLDNNLLCLLVGQELGGWGASRRDLFLAAERAARADGSAGWCLSACNAVNYTAYRGLDIRGREEVFGDGPVSCWTSFLPIAASRPVDGGYDVSGSWRYGSGSSLSRWVLVTSTLDGEGDDRMYRAHLIPREQVHIIDGSWDVMGLSATASIDYRITGAFVPRHLTFEFPSNCTSLPDRVSVRDGGRVNVIGLTAVIAGIAAGALDTFVDQAARTKRMTAESGVADDPLVQHGLAQHRGRLEAARVNLLARVDDVDRCAAAGSLVPAELGSAITLACFMVAEAARDAIMFVYWQASSSSVYRNDPLQRRVRDALVGLKHAAFTPGNLARIGKSMLGVTAGPSAV